MNKQQLTVAQRVKEIETICTSQDLRTLLDNSQTPAGLADALMVAEYMDRLGDLITPAVLASMKSLAGRSVGFEVDKEYPDHVLRDVLIEAGIRGFSLVGNEFAIIQGKFYPKAAGLRRKLRETKGFKGLKMRPGSPEMKSSGAIVPYEATWTMHGQPQVMNCEIPVKINAGMGADAVLGKAERKMLMRIYGEITASDVSLDEELRDHAEQLEIAEDYTEEVAAE